jgi:outer membrane protein TolC
MIQRLRLDPQDSLVIVPDVQITPITVDLDQAIQYGYNLRPSMQLLAIRKRRDEIDLENTKGRNSFRLNLEMTYGLEKQDEQYQELWEGHDTSYSTSINAYIPIWDWGEQKAYEEAEKVGIQQTELSIEEQRNAIKSEITNAVANLEEYQGRALNMKENMDVSMELSELSIAQFDENIISIQDILQVIERQEETELNFLEAYLGYRESLLRLMTNTHYDYEKDMSLLEQFRAQYNDNSNSTNRIARNFSQQYVGSGNNFSIDSIENSFFYK